MTDVERKWHSPRPAAKVRGLRPLSKDVAATPRPGQSTGQDAPVPFKGVTPRWSAQTTPSPPAPVGPSRTPVVPPPPLPDTAARPWQSSYRQVVALSAGQPPELPPCVGKEGVYQRAPKGADKPVQALFPRWVVPSGRCSPTSESVSSPKAKQNACTWQPTADENADVRQLLRETIRAVLARCSTVQELDATLAAARDLRQSGRGIHGRLARVLRRAKDMRESGIRSSVWRSMLAQMVNQEAQHRRFALADTAHADVTGLPNSHSGGSVARTSGDVVKSALRTSNTRAPSEQRATLGLVDVVVVGADASEAGLAGAKTAVPQDDVKRERRWRTVFGRVAKAGRIQREDLVRAMELSGFQHAVKKWMDEVYDNITMVASLNSEDFLKFQRNYDAHQREEYRKVFQDADVDGSGSVDASELAQVIASIGWRPTKKLLDECIKEVDKDNSGELSFQEFEQVMELLGATQGFMRHEREQLTKIFCKFDNNNSGTMSTAGLSAALAWLGYTRTPQEVRALAEEVDLDGSGMLELKEFMMFMRKVSEIENQTLRHAFEEGDADDSGALSVDELHTLLRGMGAAPVNQAVNEIAEEMRIQDSLTLDELIEFVQMYRDREGFARGELIEIEQAFARYATSEEVDTVDLGKILRWLGYTVAYDVQQAYVEKVDVDGSGKIELKELQKLLRMYWEDESKWMQKAFSQQDATRSGNITLEQANAAWSWICEQRGLGSGEHNALTSELEPIIAHGDLIDLNAFIQAGIQHLKAKKQTGSESGNTAEELQHFKTMFETYDADGSGTISFSELGSLVRSMFPVIDEHLRPQLDRMMREVDRNSYGSMDFQDFCLMIRQFIDLQTEERLTKEQRAIDFAGFSGGEVQEFRELFQQTDSDGDSELTWQEIKVLVANISKLNGSSMSELQRAFQEARSERAKLLLANEQADYPETLDFPEFLSLMKLLLASNFGNINNIKKGAGASAAS
mmetsp:Transcript_16014/g.40082  ORF Transcript_16014/g.40082 Transcript_16014/m.40082 type:complete len:972 (-) Transcript_16014:87-3002(-)